MKNVYAVLTVIGTVVPLSQFYKFLVENGLDFKLFFEDLFANHISSFFGWDVIISAFVVLFFIIYEAKRLKIKSFWISILGLFLAGVSCGLPLFLYLRERSLNKIHNN